MSITTALFLRFGKVIPAYKMTPEIAGQLHKNLAKVMIYVKGKGVKLTKQQAEYIINQTKQLDLYEKGITPPTPTGPKATVTDITKKLGPEAPYSQKNPKGWMPEETVSAEEEARGIRSALGFNENLVNDTINLLKDKDKKSMEQELKKIIMREGTYQDYNDSERKAILDGIQKIMQSRGGDVTFAMGGRVKYAFGTGKRGVQGILDLIKNKFGRKSITTADKVARPESAVTRDMFKQFNERMKQRDIKKQSKETYERLKKEEPGIMAEWDEMWEDPEKFVPNKDRLLTDDEIKEYEEVLGDSETWMTKGTLGEADEAIQRQIALEKQMYKEYKLDKQARKELEQAYKEIDFRMTGEDSKYEAQELADVLSDIRYQTEFYDLPQKTQIDLYGEAYDYLMDVKRDRANFKGAVNTKTGKNIFTEEQELPIDPMTGKPRKPNAKGGRIGFSVGGIDKVRRALLKMFGGAAATGVAVKTGLGGLLKGNKAKEVAKVVERVKKDAPPAYVFDLVKIIRAKGKDITKQAQTIERETVKTYKGIDLYETPDGFRIRTQNVGPYEGSKEIELMYSKTDEVKDAGLETQKSYKVEDYEEATARPDSDGKLKDVELYVEDKDHKQLEKFVEEEKKKFKSGGIAYMLGE